MRKICCKYSPSHKTLKRTPVGLGTVIKISYSVWGFRKIPWKKKPLSYYYAVSKILKSSKKSWNATSLKVTFIIKKAVGPNSLPFYTALLVSGPGAITHIAPPVYPRGPLQFTSRKQRTPTTRAACKSSEWHSLLKMLKVFMPRRDITDQCAIFCSHKSDTVRRKGSCLSA